MKPGNPPATLQEGCKFRRTMYDVHIVQISQDEGESYDATAPESQGFFVVYKTRTFVGIKRKSAVLAMNMNLEEDE